MASMLRHLLKIMSTTHHGLGSANGEGQGQRPRRALFDTVLRHHPHLTKAPLNAFFFGILSKEGGNRAVMSQRGVVTAKFVKRGW